MSTRAPIVLNATSPYEVPLNAREGKALWKEFMSRGTNHGAQAAWLPYIIRRCEREHIAYNLRAYPGTGYWIERIQR